jgi:glycosyltransferase involved in cell wall biosynthesis
MSGGTRSYEMARRMVAKGHEVHMITSDREISANMGDWEEEIIDGITIHWLGVPYDNKMSFFERVKAFFIFAFKAGSKAIFLDGDIIFATSTPLTISIPAIKAKNKLKIPMVFEVRDLWPEVPIAIGILRNPILKYFAKQLELYAYRNSEQVVTLSQGMGDGVAKTGYPNKKIHIIPNSSDITMFQVKNTEGEKFRYEHAFLNNEKLVIYAGALGKVNGVGYLVDIANEFLQLNSNVKFLIVGSGIEENSIRTKAEKLKCLNSNFFMIDQLPKSEMPALFNSATISTSFIIPVKELEANSANKFFDTLAAGKPIVINHGGWQEALIEKYNIGLVLDRDIKVAVNSLNNLLLNQSLLDTMGKNAQSLAKSHFSRDRLSSELINILESTASN